MAVDYLLAQSCKEDMSPSLQGVISDPDGGKVLPEMNMEEGNEEIYAIYIGLKIT